MYDIWQNPLHPKDLAQRGVRTDILADFPGAARFRHGLFRREVEVHVE